MIKLRKFNNKNKIMAENLMLKISKTSDYKKTELEKLETNISGISDDAKKALLLERLAKIKTEYENQRISISNETQNELNLLKNDTFAVYWIKMEYQDLSSVSWSGDLSYNYINLEGVTDKDSLSKVLNLIKNNKELKLALIDSLQSQKFLNSLNKQNNSNFRNLISENLDDILAAAWLCNETLVLSIRNIREWFWNFEKSKENLIKQLPLDKQETVKNEIDLFIKSTGVCSKTIALWIKDILNKEWVTNIDEAKIAEIIKTGAKIKGFQNANELAILQGKYSVKDNVWLEKLKKDGLLEKEDADKYAKIIWESQRLETISNGFTAKDVHIALNSSDEEYKNYMNRLDTIVLANQYLLSKDWENRFLGLAKKIWFSSMEELVNNRDLAISKLKKLKPKPWTKEAELLAILWITIDFEEKNEKLEKKIEIQDSEKEKIKSDEVKNQSYIPNIWETRYISIDRRNKDIKISVLNTWEKDVYWEEKYIVKSGKSEEICYWDKEVKNTIRAWKFISNLWFWFIMNNAVKIKKLLIDKWILDFNQKDWLDENEKKKMLSVLLYSVWQKEKEWEPKFINQEIQVLKSKLKTMKWEWEIISKAEKTWIMNEWIFSIERFENIISSNIEKLRS